MYYLKKAFAYANTKFLWLILLSALPAIGLTCWFSPSRIIWFICNYSQADTSSFQAIYRQLVWMDYKYSWLIIIAFAVVAVCVSMIVGLVDNHMRTGQFSFGAELFKSRINYNIISVFKFLIACFCVFELYLVFAVTLIYLFSKLSYGVALAFIIICVLVLCAAMASSFALLLVWLPNMLHTGLSSSSAMELGVRQIAKKFIDVAVAIVLPAVPMFILMVVNGLVILKIGFLLDCILYLIMVGYFIVLSETVFFEINGIERADLEKVDIWKKSFKE